MVATLLIMQTSVSHPPVENSHRVLSPFVQNWYNGSTQVSGSFRYVHTFSAAYIRVCFHDARSTRVRRRLHNRPVSLLCVCPYAYGRTAALPAKSTRGSRRRRLFARSQCSYGCPWVLNIFLCKVAAKTNCAEKKWVLNADNSFLPIFYVFCYIFLIDWLVMWQLVIIDTFF